MSLREPHDGLILFDNLAQHVGAVAIVGPVVWIRDSEPTGFVPPRIGAHVRPVHQEDPGLGVAFLYLIELIGPLMALEYACASGVEEWCIQVCRIEAGVKFPPSAKIGTKVTGEVVMAIGPSIRSVRDIEASDVVFDVLCDARPA